MKISINSQFLEGPYGGGMQFANFMREYLRERGHTVVNDLKSNDIDIILHVNPFPKLTPKASAYSYLDAYKYKRKHPKAVIIERVNECDERKGTNYVNRLLVEAAKHSDFVVFIASWLRPLLLKVGLPEKMPYKVIKNGADQKIFNIDGKEFWNGKDKLKVVTHHWSDNPKKGHRLYQQIDNLLEDERFNSMFEFTYIGRMPKGAEYRNSKVLEPISGKELADELKRHHIYITASENEPAGMHHIEGALCGLPLLYINSGALPEYCGDYGLEFNEVNLPDKLIEMKERYEEFRDKISKYPNNALRMGNEYLALLEYLYANKKSFALKRRGLKKFVPNVLKRPIMAVYILSKLTLRGPRSKAIKLNLAGVLPAVGKVVHGGKVKLLPLREKFGDTWKGFNLAYFVSSGLPFAPSIWLRLYKLFGIKIVWNQNGVAYPALYSPEVVQKINDLYKPINLCDHVVYQTEFCKRCADKFTTKFTGPCSILVNPVDTNHFKPRKTPLPQEPLVLIMSGNHFESQERMDVSLAAVRKLRADGLNVQLVIIGKADFVVNEDWIEHKGAFLQRDAPALYQSAHMLLHLKYLDPCPTIVLEALSCGLPVVSTTNGGLPEMVDEKSGVLIPIIEDFEKLHYPNPGDVADAILRIRDHLPEYSRSAREQALKFDKEPWLEKHKEIFNNLLK